MTPEEVQLAKQIFAVGIAVALGGLYWWIVQEVLKWDIPATAKCIVLAIAAIVLSAAGWWFHGVLVRIAEANA